MTQKNWLTTAVSNALWRLSALLKPELMQLKAAETLDMLGTPPGNRLEALKRDRKGQYSIRINGQWRLCFRFENGHAYDVEIVDYH